MIDESWKENDALVNTVSSRAPFKEPSVVYQQGHKIEKGVWHIMEKQDMDHLSFSGGMFNMGWSRIRKFYINHLQTIESL